MASPGPNPIRRFVLALAGCAGLLAGTTAPAAAGYLLTFTGTFDGSDNFSSRFDGTNVFDDDLPPLFDLARLDGGTFRATITLPSFAPDQRVYYFAPPAPVAFTLFDAAGATVHQGSGAVSVVGVANNAERRQGRGAEDHVKFSGSILTGFTPPPETYGPNVIPDDSLLFLGFYSRFPGRSGGPIDDESIPVDGATYLAFDDRTFFFDLTDGNGDFENANGPFLYVSTSASYTVTGASVVTTAAVPEPASLGLLAAGGLGLLARRLRRRTATA